MVKIRVYKGGSVVLEEICVELRPVVYCNPFLFFH